MRTQEHYKLPSGTVAWLRHGVAPTSPVAQWAVARVEWALHHKRPIVAARADWAQAQLLVPAAALGQRARIIRDNLAKARAMGFLDEWSRSRA